jgi:hypothetical protein
MIAVPAGGSTLESSFGSQDGQEYEITISTVLTAFWGKREDSDAQLFPIADSNLRDCPVALVGSNP